MCFVQKNTKKVNMFSPYIACIMENKNVKKRSCNTIKKNGSNPKGLHCMNRNLKFILQEMGKPIVNDWQERLTHGQA